MIDLHTHTNESDGTLSPSELIDAAIAAGLDALAITDHDTFAGYDAALPYARERGFNLVCGIELSCKEDGRTVHLLGYFVHGAPTPKFRAWLENILEARRDRNRRLAERLRSFGLDIQLAEVEKLGRTLTGRPHFATLMVRKGYVRDRDEAFRKYIGESGAAFVERSGPSLETAVEMINEAGGIASLAHPTRIRCRSAESREALIAELARNGLGALEVWHSDHTPEETDWYLALARKIGLAPTGGSDFHGDVKPGTSLGTGINGNLEIPASALEDLRRR